MFANIITGFLALFFLAIAYRVATKKFDNPQQTAASIVVGIISMSIAVVFAILTSVDW